MNEPVFVSGSKPCRAFRGEVEEVAAEGGLDLRELIDSPIRTGIQGVSSLVRGQGWSAVEQVEGDASRNDTSRRSAVRLAEFIHPARAHGLRSVLGIVLAGGDGDRRAVGVVEGDVPEPSLE